MQRRFCSHTKKIYPIIAKVKTVGHLLSNAPSSVSVLASSDGTYAENWVLKRGTFEEIKVSI